MNHYKVKAESINIFLKTCRIAGENSVVELLKNVNSSEELLFKYIEGLIIKECHVDKNYLKSGQAKYNECKWLLSYFFHKYLNYSVSQISDYFDCTERNIYGYFDKIKKLDDRLSYDKKLFHKIDKIDININNFLNIQDDK